MSQPNLIRCLRLLTRAGLAASLALLCSQAAAQVQWNLVWSDEFTGLTNTAPDSTRWGYDGPNAGAGNSELETYCGQAGAGQGGVCTNWLQNAHHDGQGNLIISAVLKNGKWTSARLITHDKLVGFTYGRAEARMKLPVGNGLWPAFWMLGDNLFSGTSWPACGEADMMENVTSLGAGAIRSTVHGPGFSTNSPLYRDFTFPSGGRVDTAYHVYGVIWTTNSVQYYVDDYTKPFAVFTPAMMPPGGVWPFNNHSFFLILDLAVGGTWPGTPDASTPNPANMYIDYVRVYRPAPPPYLVEAEYASAGGGIASNYWAGYSATGYRGFVNSSGEYIEWKTYSPFAGLQPLQFRYANGATSTRTMELKLNGAVVAGSLGFPSTGSWGNWSTVTSTARLIPGTNSIRLTTTGLSGPNIDYLLVGSGSNPPAGLALRLPLDDPPGTTTTLSDTNRGAADIRAQMFDTNNMPADFHGAPGSGVSGIGSALDFSSDHDGGLGFNLPGAVAVATNQLNLGFQTVTSFIASVWFKLDSMFTNNVNRGGRVFILGTNGVADQGGTNSLSLSFFSQNQLQYKLNSNTVAAVYPGNVPTNTWLFYAIVYDGSTANVFSGTETSPAVLVNTTNNLNGPQAINFGSLGALLLGNRVNLDRALDGWIQDFRFYTFSRSPSFVEDIRWSAMGPTGLTASPGPNGVTLTWNPVPGAASYNVLRSTNSGSAYSILATGITGTSYTDSTVAPGTTYFYVVSAVDGSGGATSSQNSNEAAVTASAPALTILYTGTNSTLSWPSSAAGFNLYGASNLTPPAVWSRITAPVMNQGGTFSVSVPVNGTQFFRLSMP